MRPRLISRVRAPYGGIYAINDPLTGKPIEGTTFDMLINRAVAQRQANSTPIGLEFEDEIENALCAKYPAECEVSTRTIRPRTQLNFWDAVRGTAAIFVHKASGLPLVSQEEANRRAAICRACPFNVQMHMPCTRCFSAIENVVSAVISGNHSTPDDHQLRSCSICGCWTKASVWVALESQCQVVTDGMREAFKFAVESFNCWKQC